ncbi:hypothetical protein [Larkinella humicola]|uniref:Uncharacterized protein n=1 Tax=Larkinella humicola TaxID=2607654 RepID=A0A5N1JL48_9BACT|nr:hypothetical protein [Larkinella humicola]KAA9356246.1 hypothetical protein F0P93_00380 [Larkinella humicola]
MMHTITIETQNDADFELFKGLAQRLGLRIRETHTEGERSEAEELRLLNRVAGGWKSDESGDELAAMLQNARSFHDRNIHL